jgi:hypothetical protein
MHSPIHTFFFVSQLDTSLSWRCSALAAPLVFTAVVRSGHVASTHKRIIDQNLYQHHLHRQRHGSHRLPMLQSLWVSSEIDMPNLAFHYSTHHYQCHCEAVHSIGPQRHLVSNCHRSVQVFYHGSLARRIYRIQHQPTCAAMRRCDVDCVSITAQPPCTHSCVDRAAVTAGTRRSLATPPTLDPTIASWGRPRGGGAAEDGSTC